MPRDISGDDEWIGEFYVEVDECEGVETVRRNDSKSKGRM